MIRVRVRARPPGSSLVPGFMLSLTLHWALEWTMVQLEWQLVYVAHILASIVVQQLTSLVLMVLAVGLVLVVIIVMQNEIIH